MVIHSRIIIDPKPKERQPFKTRGEVKRQMSKIMDLIKKVGLTKYKNTKVSKLSGGQKQRVAIARALARETPIIIADEPTGNLDPDTSMEIMKVLEAINELGTTIIMVTHDREIVNKMKKRTILLEAGRILKDYEKGTYEYEGV